MKRPTPKHKAPELSFPLLSGYEWNLSKQSPENFTMIVFYRGLHCPICKKYLQLLQEFLPDFKDKGVNIVAVSMDSEARARKSRKDWEIGDLDLGYDLSKEAAKNWGLFLSEAIKEGEPDVFSEPGLYLIDQNDLVYYSAINSNPWGRPYLPSMVKALNYIVDAGYPARGELI